MKKAIFSTIVAGLLVTSGSLASAEAIKISDSDIVMQNGTALIPMRSIFQLLNAKVDWNGETQTVTATKEGKTIILTIGKTTAYINGVATPITTPPQLVNGNTLIPLRFVGEALGQKVNWDNNSRMITVETGEIATQVGTVSTPTTISGATKEETIKETTTTTPFNNETFLKTMKLIEEKKLADPNYNPVYDLSIVDQATQPKQAEPSGGVTTAKGITTLYGSHTYGCDSQAEFDEAWGIIAKNIDGANLSASAFPAPFMDFLYNGKKYDASIGSRDRTNVAYKVASSDLGALISNGVSKEEIVRVFNLARFATDLSAGLDDPKDGSPKSIYDALVRKVSDCDSGAQIISAVFDYFGYNTAVVGGNNHAVPLVKIGDKWYDPTGGTFIQYKNEPSKVTGSYLVSKPTYN